MKYKNVGNTAISDKSVIKDKSKTDQSVKDKSTYKDKTKAKAAGVIGNGNKVKQSKGIPPYLSIWA